MPECPTCSDEFSTEMGVKTHHWQIHDEKIGETERSCKNCGAEFTVSDYVIERGEGNFCSPECYHNSMSTKVTVECKTCGKKKNIKKYQYEKFENHFCSNDCYAEHKSESMSGKGNHMWKDGVDWIPYGAKYYKNRQKVIERDLGECIICGDDNIEVHHITPRVKYRVDGEILPEANDMSNLVTLCRKHHKEYEGKYTNLSADEFKSKVLSE